MKETTIVLEEMMQLVPSHGHRLWLDMEVQVSERYSKVVVERRRSIMCGGTIVYIVCGEAASQCILIRVPLIDR